MSNLPHIRYLTQPLKSQLVALNEKVRPSHLEKDGGVYLLNLTIPSTPQIVELFEMSELSDHSTSSVEFGTPMFQAAPQIVIFRNFVPFNSKEETLILRNVDTVARRIRVLPISNSKFTIVHDYANNNVLSHHSKIAPGMEARFIVKFSPTDTEDCQADIYVCTEREKFIIPVRAIGNRAVLTLPDSVSFSACTVGKVHSKKLVARNNGNRSASVEISCCSDCFSCNLSNSTSEDVQTISTSSSNNCILYVPLNQMASFDINFFPSDLVHYEGELTLKFDTGEIAFMSLDGAGQNVDVGLSARTVCMEPSYISLMTNKSVKIVNKSDEPVKFCWKSFSTVAEEEEERDDITSQLNRYELEEVGEFSNSIDSSDDSFDAKVHLAALGQKYNHLRRALNVERFLFIDDTFDLSPLEGVVWAHAELETTVSFHPSIAAHYTSATFLELEGRDCRIPLHIVGEGIGPSVSISDTAIDTGKMIIHTTKEFRLTLQNRGYIIASWTGTAEIQPSPNAANAKISIEPSSGVLPVEGVCSVSVFVTGMTLGEIDNLVTIVLEGSDTPLKCCFIGSVIGPTICFDCPSIQFGEVGFETLATKNVTLVNTSDIAANINIRIQHDRQEFMVHPSSLSMSSGAACLIQVSFCPIIVRSIDNCKICIDVEGVGDNLVSIPITAQVVVPSLTIVSNELDFGDCFLNYCYIRHLTLRNDSTKVSAAYKIISPMQNSEWKANPPAEVDISEPIGSIPVGSTKSIEVKLIALIPAAVKIPIQVETRGSPIPPIAVNGTFTSHGPIVTASKAEIHWGNIPCLTDVCNDLTIYNKSPVPANLSFYVSRVQSRFKPRISNVMIQPNENYLLEVDVNLDDFGSLEDSLHIVVQKGSLLSIPMSVRGIGTTLVYRIDKELCTSPVCNISNGYILAGSYFEKNIIIENRGRRQVQLKWKNVTAEENNAMAKKKPKKPAQVKPKPSESEGETKDNETKGHTDESKGQQDASYSQVVTVEPSEVILRPHSGTTFCLKGRHDTAQHIEETLVCWSRSGKDRDDREGVTLIMAADFVDPLVETIPSSVSYTYEWYKSGDVTESENDDVFEDKYQKTLTLTNKTQVSLSIVARTESPFSIRPWEFVIEAGQSAEALVKFDHLFSDDKQSQTVNKTISLSYKGHKQRDTIPLTAQVYYPNVVLSSQVADFGCILNETRRQIVINVQNKSKLEAKFKWSLVRDDWFDMPVTMNTNESVSGNARRSLGAKSTSFDFQNFVPLSIENVFDIQPISGIVKNGESISSILTFYGHENHKVHGQCVCQVEGGPEYEVSLSGSASAVLYSLDKNLVDFGILYYTNKETQTINISNTGKVPFQFVVRSDLLNFANVFTISPEIGTIAAGANQVLSITFRPRVPDVFNDTIRLEIGHLEPTIVTVHGEGKFQSFHINLPRDNSVPVLCDLVYPKDWPITDTRKVVNESCPYIPTIINIYRNQLNGQQESKKQDLEHDKTGEDWKIFEEISRAKISQILSESEDDSESFRQLLDVEMSRYLFCQWLLYHQLALEEGKALKKLKESSEAIAITNQQSNSEVKAPTKKLKKQVGLSEKLMQPVRRSNSRISMDAQSMSSSMVGCQEIDETSSLPHSSIEPEEEMLDPISEEKSVSAIAHLHGKPGVSLQSSSTYVCDFGNVVKGETKKHTFTVYNTSGFGPLSWNIDKRIFTGSGFAMDPLKIVRLLEKSSVSSSVSFTALASLNLGEHKIRVPIDIREAPLTHIVLKATVCEPLIEILPINSLDFRGVLIGHSRAQFIQVHNASSVIAKCTIRKPMVGSSHAKFFEFFTYNGPNSNDISPISSFQLRPDQRINIEVEFSPTEVKRYSSEFNIKVSSSTSKPNKINLCGNGLSMDLVFHPGAIIEFQPLNLVSEKFKIQPVEIGCQLKSPEGYVGTEELEANISIVQRKEDANDNNSLLQQLLDSRSNLFTSRPVPVSSSSQLTLRSPIFKDGITHNQYLQNLLNGKAEWQERVVEGMKMHFIVGPACSGVTSLCQKLSSTFSVGVLSLDSIIEEFCVTFHDKSDQLTLLLGNLSQERQESMHAELSELKRKIEEEKNEIIEKCANEAITAAQLAWSTAQASSKKKIPPVDEDAVRKESMPSTEVLDSCESALRFKNASETAIMRSVFKCEDENSTIDSANDKLSQVSNWKTAMVNALEAATLWYLNSQASLFRNGVIVDLSNTLSYVYDGLESHEISLSYRNFIETTLSDCFLEVLGRIPASKRSLLKLTHSSGYMKTLVSRLSYNESHYESSIRDALKGIESDLEQLPKNNINPIVDQEYISLIRHFSESWGKVISPDWLNPLDRSINKLKNDEILMLMSQREVDQYRGATFWYAHRMHKATKRQTERMSDRLSGLKTLPDLTTLFELLQQNTDIENRLLMEPVSVTNSAYRLIGDSLIVKEIDVGDCNTISDIIVGNFTMFTSILECTRSEGHTFPFPHETTWQVIAPQNFKPATDQNNENASTFKLISSSENEQSSNGVEMNQAIVKFGSSLKAELNFCPITPGSYDATFSFICNNFSFAVDLKCTAKCDIPSINITPESIFLGISSFDSVPEDCTPKTGFYKSDNSYRFTPLTLGISSDCRTPSDEVLQYMKKQASNAQIVPLVKKKSKQKHPKASDNQLAENARNYANLSQSNSCLLHLTNSGLFPCSIVLSIDQGEVDPSKERLETFFLDDQKANVLPGTTITTRLWAFPQQAGPVTCTIKILEESLQPGSAIEGEETKQASETSEIANFNILCEGFSASAMLKGPWIAAIQTKENECNQCTDKKMKPILEAQLKNMKEGSVMGFSPLLLANSQTQDITLQNNGNISIKWKFESKTDVEEANSCFCSTMAEGVLEAKSDQAIPIQFRATQEGALSKMFSLVYFPANQEQSAASQTCVFEAKGEGYCVKTVSFPDRDSSTAVNEIDFGQIRVGDTKSATLPIKNIGKYPIDLVMSCLPSSILFSVEPSERRNLASGDTQVFTITATASGNTEVKVLNLKAMECQIFDSRLNDSDSSEKFCAEKFPIIVHARSSFAKFRVFPPKLINFGCERFDEPEKTKAVTIRNDGEKEFSFLCDLSTNDDSSDFGNGLYLSQSLADALLWSCPAGLRSVYKKSILTKESSKTKLEEKEGDSAEIFSNVPFPTPKQVTFETFSIKPHVGSVLPGESVNITVSYKPSGNRVHNANMRIFVTGSDPNDDTAKQAREYIVTGQSSVPGINVGDMKAIFEEQRIVVIDDDDEMDKSLSYYDINHNTLNFGKVLLVDPKNPNQQYTERVKISNPTRVSTHFSADITSSQTGNKESYNRFTVKPAQFDLGPYESKYLSILFSPSSLQDHSGVVDVHVDNWQSLQEFDDKETGSNNVLRASGFKFLVKGTGVLPSLSFRLPDSDSATNVVGENDLSFGNVYYQQLKSKKVIVSNSGCLTASCVIEAKGAGYYVSQIASAEYSSISMQLEPKQLSEFYVSFKNLNNVSSKNKGELKMTILQNPYESRVITLLSECTQQTLICENAQVHHVTGSPNPMDELRFSDVSLVPNQSDQKTETLFVRFRNTGKCLLRYQLPVPLEKSSGAVKNSRPTLPSSVTSVPSLGHLMPQEERVVQFIFSPLEPIVHSNIPLSITVNEIQLQSSNDEQKSWDNEMELSEPQYQMLPTSAAQSVSLAIFAKSDFGRVSLSSNEVIFKATAMFQVRKAAITISNVSNIQLPLRWHLEDRRRASALSTSQSKRTVSDDPDSFWIEPNELSLMPESSSQIEVFYRPQDVEDITCSLVLDTSCNVFSKEMSKVTIALCAHSYRPICHIEVEESATYLTEKRKDGFRNEVGQFAPIQAKNLRVVETVCHGINISSSASVSILNTTNESYDYLWQAAGEPSTQWTCTQLSGRLGAGSRIDCLFTYSSVRIGIQETFYRFCIPNKGAEELFLFAGISEEAKVTIVPSKIDFGYCLIGQESTANFSIVNHESTPITFFFDKSALEVDSSSAKANSSNALKLSRTTGSIAPNSSFPVSINFSPQSEEVMNQNILCHFRVRSAPLRLNVKAEGYAVHTDIMYGIHSSTAVTANMKPTRNSIDFGTVEVDDSRKQIIVLVNRGKSNTDYCWQVPISDMLENGIRMNLAGSESSLNSHGTLHKGETLQFELSYTPKIQGQQVSNLSMTLVIAAMHEYEFALVAKCKNPAVHFSWSKFDFGPCFVMSSDAVETESEQYKSDLAVTNNDPHETMVIDCVNRPTATLSVVGLPLMLKPNDCKTISILFTPREEKQYTQTLSFSVNGTSTRYFALVTGTGIIGRLELMDLNSSVINLPLITVGQATNKSFSLINRSARQMTFSIIDEDSKCQEKGIIVSSSQSLSKLVVEAHSVLLCKLQFQPTKRVAPFTEFLYTRHNGVTKRLLSIIGQCTGMETCIDLDYVSFGSVCGGAFKTRDISLSNMGEFPVQFSVLSASGPLAPRFDVPESRGIVLPQTDKAIRIAFRPLESDAGKEVRRDDVTIRVETVSSTKSSYSDSQLFRVTLTGNCVVRPTGHVATLQFTSTVRSASTQSITITNPSQEAWSVSPSLYSDEERKTADDVWSWEPQSLFIKPQERQQLTIMYKPLLTRNNNASLFLSATDGTLLSYSLSGTTTAPTASGKLQYTIPAKDVLLFSLTADNWLAEKQHFDISHEILDVDKTDTRILSTIQLSYCSSADVAGGGRKQIPFKFTAFKEGSYSVRVTLRNSDSAEFMFYDISIAVTEAMVLATLRLEAPLRSKTRQVITIENPFPVATPVTMPTGDSWWSCDDPEILVTIIQHPSGRREGTIQIEYRPTTLLGGNLESKERNLTVRCNELGQYRYKLQLIPIPPVTRQFLRFRTEFGTPQTEIWTFKHYSKLPIEYTLRIEGRPDCFQAQVGQSTSSIIACKATSSWDGDDVAVKVCFDPQSIGHITSILRVTGRASASEEAVSWECELVGVTTAPLAQGPIVVTQQSRQATIRFTNPLSTQEKFVFQLDGIATTTVSVAPPTNTQVVIAAKTLQVITLSLVEQLGQKQTVQGRITIKCASRADIPVWIYYLEARGE